MWAIDSWDRRVTQRNTRRCAQIEIIDDTNAARSATDARWARAGRGALCTSCERTHNIIESIVSANRRSSYYHLNDFKGCLWRNLAVWLRTCYGKNLGEIRSRWGFSRLPSSAAKVDGRGPAIHQKTANRKRWLNNETKVLIRLV